MPLPLIPILLVGGGLFAAASSAQKKSKERRDRSAREIYIAQCPMDPSLSPDQAQAVRVAMSAALLGQRSPAELAADAQMLAAAGYPQAAACLAGFASSLAAGK